MNEKIQEAFGQIQVEDELKHKTKEFIFRKTNGYTRAGSMNYKYVVSAVVCFLFFILGGYWLYFTPAIEISIDINPSIELGINRFERVVSAASYNEDGQKLLDSLDIRFMDYSEAIRQIVENKEIEALLSNNEIMTVTVVEKENVQSGKVLSEIQSCMAGRTDMYCEHAYAKEVDNAHEVGLSYGKYKAFLELQALNPDITVEEIENMTMREIRDLTQELSCDEQEIRHSKKEKDTEHEKDCDGQGKKNRIKEHRK